MSFKPENPLTNDQTISINSISDVLNAAQAENNTIDENPDTNPFDIFSNPQIKKAKESLPPNVRRQYEQIGENIWNQMESSQKYLNNTETFITDEENHGGMNVEQNFDASNLPPPVEEAAANISEAIKSGMHPTLLDTDEEKVMVHCFGEKWYERFGYNDQDMKEII